VCHLCKLLLVKDHCDSKLLSKMRTVNSLFLKHQLTAVVVLVTLSTLKVCQSVRLLSDSVIPPHALKGHQAVLRCNYDMEGDDLYSVKWYFNQKEFYRFIPSDNPKVTIFNHHKGVKVNARLSTEREVVLDDVDFSTSGDYRCEVSGDAPMFQTASINGILFVVDLPDKGPDISGGVPRYNIGDRVNVTCLSRNSMPAAQLAWYVNGEKADAVHLRTYPEETTRDGLKTSRLGLTFKAATSFGSSGLRTNITLSLCTKEFEMDEIYESLNEKLHEVGQCYHSIVA